MENKILSLAGIAKKAGMLEYGTERLREAIRRSEIKLVVIASDASGNTEKRLQNCCAYYGVPFIKTECSSDEIGHAVGLRGAAASFGVCDRGIADAMLAQFMQMT